MTRTLYLHVGMPKCASTTIQDALAQLTSEMSALGKSYRFFKQDKSTAQGNASKLFVDLLHDKESSARRQLDFFLGDGDDVILSSEMLVGLARTDRAAVLVDHAVSHGYSPKLICFVRRQDLWIESDYKQHIKGGLDWTGNIGALLRKRRSTRVLDYHWMLSNWAKYVGPEAITVVPLAPGQAADYPILRFLEFAGMPLELAEKLSLSDKNVSPPTCLIEPARLLKMELLSRGLKMPQVRQQVARFMEDARETLVLPDRRYSLPYEKRVALLQEYRDSNTQLGDTFLGGQAPFDDDIPQEPENTLPLAKEAAGILAAYVAERSLRD